MFIIDLESMTLYEISRTTNIFAAPRGLLVWDRYQAIDLFKDHIKKMAEEIQPDLKGRFLYNLCIIDGKLYNITNKDPIKLEGNECVEHYKRWIDYWRVIIWNQHNKNTKLKLTYIKM